MPGPHNPPLHALIFLGPPGTGKGTQAKLLHQQFHLPHVSTGDLLREHIQQSSELGKLAKTYMNQGQLVPDPLILKMLFERLSKSDCSKGYVLDGFPRTLPQARALQDYLKDKTIPLVINLSLSKKKILERLTKRVVCSQCGTPYHLLYAPPRVAGVCNQCQGPLVHREDDTKAVILKRLQVYQEQTEPLIEFYTSQRLLHTLDCRGDKQAIFREILTLMTPNNAGQ